MNEPIFRPSFAELQVGDVFFTLDNGLGDRPHHVNEVTRLTPKYFICGYGEVNEKGKHQHETTYKRDTGRCSNSSVWYNYDAILPTPANFTANEQKKADIKTWRKLHLIEENITSVSIEDARAIVAFFTEKYPQLIEGPKS